MIDQIHSVSHSSVVGGKKPKPSGLKQVLMLRQMKIPAMPDMLQKKRVPNIHVPKPKVY